MARPAQSIDLGKFRFRVTWQKQSTVSQPGQDASSWDDVGLLWGYLKPIYATESMTADQQRAVNQLTVVVRGNPDIRASDRLIYGSRQRVLNVIGLAREDMDQGFSEFVVLESAD